MNKAQHQNLQNTITKVYEVGDSVKRKSTNRDETWWNSELTKLRKSVRQLFEKAINEEYLENNRKADFNEYKLYKEIS